MNDNCRMKSNEISRSSVGSLASSYGDRRSLLTPPYEGGGGTALIGGEGFSGSVFQKFSVVGEIPTLYQLIYLLASLRIKSHSAHRIYHESKSDG